MVAGWQVSGVTTLQSGSPVNITLSNDQANIGITGQQRPDLIGAVPSLNCVPDPARPPRLMNCYDASAFALPAQFTFGNASRNLLRGPKFVNTDLSFMKNVPVGPANNEVRLQVRIEIFNVFNTVNWGNPNASFGSASFGQITSAGSMRQVQLGGKLLF